MLTLTVLYVLYWSATFFGKKMIFGYIVPLHNNESEKFVLVQVLRHWHRPTNVGKIDLEWQAGNLIQGLQLK